MLLKKIQGSSIAEVVIALAVIGLCFGIASLVFVRATMVTTSFEEVRLQTEIQSSIWETMHDVQFPNELETVHVSQENDPNNDSLEIQIYTGDKEKIIWQQQQLKFD